MPRPPRAAGRRQRRGERPLLDPAAGRPHRAEGHRPAARGGTDAVVSVIELGPLAVEIAQAIVSGFPGERVQAAIERLAGADAVIASTPVYKAGISGLFKSFVDLLDNDLLIAKPVVLAATAGTARHAMVVDEQLRPLFAFLRAIPVPTSLFAAPEDWGSSTLGERIERRRHRARAAAAQRRRPVDRRPRVGRLPAPVLGQRHPRRAGRGRRRLRHRPHAARRRRRTMRSRAIQRGILTPGAAFGGSRPRRRGRARRRPGRARSAAHRAGATRARRRSPALRASPTPWRPPICAAARRPTA